MMHGAYNVKSVKKYQSEKYSVTKTYEFYFFTKKNFVLILRNR